MPPLCNSILQKFKMAIPRTQDNKGLDYWHSDPSVSPKSDACSINELPPELLSRIFERGPVYRADAAENNHSPPRWFPEFQIRVSHVCRHWRNVAISTPSLWTEITVDPCSTPPYTLVATLLERSKSLPIDIFIVDLCLDDQFKHLRDDHLHADFAILFTMLIPHISRWGIMRMSLQKFDIMLTFLSGISDRSIPAATNLKRFELYCYSPEDRLGILAYPNTSQDLALFGDSTPPLTRLALARVPVNWDQPWIASAFALKELYLASHAERNRPSWAQFSVILRSASNLEKLVLSESGPSGDPATWFISTIPGGDPLINDPINLPRLATLELAHYSQAPAVGLLRKLCLPALQHLDLDLRQDDYTQFVHELVKPAPSPSPHSAAPPSRGSLLSGLESLQIAYLPCDDECVEMLYSELQNVRSLALSMKYLSARFFDMLGMPCTSAGGGGVWLPRLEALYVYGAVGAALRTLVRERKRLGTPVDALYLEKGSSVSEAELAWLRRKVKTVEIFRGSVNLGRDDSVSLA